MWCEQNNMRTLSAVSHQQVNLLPYSDDNTNRAAGLRGWLSRRVASGARVTSCSHSYRQFFPNASVHSGACTFPSPGFSWKVQQGVYGLPRESCLLSPTLGSAASSSAASHSLRSAFSRCAAAVKEALLWNSVTTRWRWAWRVTTRWRRARPCSLPEGGRTSFFACLGLPVKPLDDGIPECDCVRVFGCRASDTAIPLHLTPVARESCEDLASSTARWTRMVTLRLEGVGDTSEESLLHSLAGSQRASIGFARLPLLLALQKVTMPFGVQSPYCFF